LTAGLVRDDEAMHPERLKLWTEFNNCWLVVLQRQKELTLDARAKGLPGGRPNQPLTLMEPELMESMGKEIVRLCDIMEKFGLVDYEMGVWEEDIINRKRLLHAEIDLTDAVLTECLDLLEEPTPPTGGPVQQPPAARRR
jgi:hypothetical protein